MTVANNGGSGNDNRNAPAHHEQALKASLRPQMSYARKIRLARDKLILQTWALSLPRHMRFDENTLTAAVARLNSPVPTISRSGWLFAYMHAVAECGMFYLQAALATNGASWTAQRQAQAVDNIAVILEAIGSRGRASPLSELCLGSCLTWLTHSALSPPRRQQLARTPPQFPCCSLTAADVTQPTSVSVVGRFDARLGFRTPSHDRARLLRRQAPPTFAAPTVCVWSWAVQHIPVPTVRVGVVDIELFDHDIANPRDLRDERFTSILCPFTCASSTRSPESQHARLRSFCRVIPALTPSCAALHHLGQRA